MACTRTGELHACYLYVHGGLKKSVPAVMRAFQLSSTVGSAIDSVDRDGECVCGNWMSQ